MKKYGWIALIIWSAGMFTACEDDIFPELEVVNPVLVIDAWVNNRPVPQVIRINRTLPYYEAQTPPGVSNALVYITDETGRLYTFTEGTNPGEYLLLPDSSGSAFQAIGLLYQLSVEVDNEIYFAQSVMNRVPEIDSIAFRFERDRGFIQSSYFAELYARDLEGPGDTYWIKTWKNGEFLQKPSEMNLVFDAGFSAGGNVDGITFVQPVRDGINPFEIDDNDRLVPPYLPGDQVYVEIHSVTNEAFYFLQELRIQTDRHGGFAELFAIPLSNIPTNIKNVNQKGSSALGYFNIAAVSTAIATLDPNDLPE